MGPNDASRTDTRLNWETYSIASLYDSIGPKYEIAYANIPAQRKSLEWLISHLPHDGSKVLDIGCGTGHPVASTLASSPGHHRVYGIDISEAMLSAARSSVPSAIFERVDFRDFQAEPSTFEAITSYFALLVAMSQDQIRDMVQKFFTWLKHGGLLVMSTIPADLEHFEQTWLGRKGIFTSLSADQYITLLRDIGFVVEYSVVENFMPKAAEAGICGVGEVMAEPQLFIYAQKP